MPLINAPRILSTVLLRAIHEEDTISQAFRHIAQREFELNSFYHYLSIERRVRFIIEYCRTMRDIRKELYAYRSPSEVLNLDASSDDEHAFEPGSPPWNPIGFERFYSESTIMTSTPLTDDEGYRTRLPTTASAESSFMCFHDFSPVGPCMAMDTDPSSVFGDDSI